MLISLLVDEMFLPRYVSLYNHHLATSPYRSSPLAGLQGYIMYPYIAAVCMFELVGDISTLDGTCLKLVDKFTYLWSSVSLTEKDIDTRLTKAWTAFDWLSII